MTGQNRKTWRLDWNIAFLSLALGVTGLVLIYSASSSLESSFFAGPFGRQTVWFISALACGLICTRIPMPGLKSGAYVLYGTALILLGAVLAAGRGDVHRWIEVSGFYMQPSEAAKIACILMLARFLDDHSRLPQWKKLVYSLGLTIPAVLLIIREPDMGSALVFCAIWGVMVLWSGVSVHWMLLFAAPFTALAAGLYLPVFIGFLCAVLVWAVWRSRSWWKALLYTGICGGIGMFSTAFWAGLPQYQQERLLIFLGIKSDPHGSAYQVIQSKVAIGSGGLLGKGFLNGSQSQLRFLPEQHTDFIVSVLGEEFGFLGITVVFILFFLLFVILIRAALTARDDFESLTVMGVFAMLAVQTAVNTGMASGIVPVTGMTLPFLSYGGSSLVVCFAGAGLVSNISMNRFLY